eukprot:224032-Chlamydomonas_euryale.AAC.1
MPQVASSVRVLHVRNQAHATVCIVCPPFSVLEPSRTANVCPHGTSATLWNANSERGGHSSTVYHSHICVMWTLCCEKTSSDR